MQDKAASSVCQVFKQAKNSIGIKYVLSGPPQEMDQHTLTGPDKRNGDGGRVGGGVLT